MRVIVAAKTILIIAAIILIASCSDSGARTVGGIDEKFCVPAEYRISNYWWIQGNFSPESKGFSFHGCRFSRLVGDRPCELPYAVRGGSVEQRDLNNHIEWAVLKSSVTLSSLATDSAKLELRDRGSVIVASAPSTRELWFVFERDLVARPEGLMLADKDKLLVTCGPSGRSQHVFECDRYVRNERYALRYHFDSSERVPLETVRELDRKLIETIDGWQCGK
jgi:hypothetical protein